MDVDENTSDSEVDGFHSDSDTNEISEEAEPVRKRTRNKESNNNEISKGKL